MKAASECGVPMDIGPIILDRKNRLSNFYMKSDFVKQLRILGSAQIVLGVICITAHAINMVIHRSFYLPGLPQVGYGFWNGAIFLLTGTLGVVSGLQRYKITTVLFGFMSILSAFLTVALFTLAIVSGALCAINDHWVNDYTTRGYSGHRAYGTSEYPVAQRVAIAMEIIMAVAAVVEAFVAIRSILTVRKTGVSCRDACCPSDRTSSQHFLSCRVGSCFWQCIGSCDSPSNSSSDQLSLIDPEHSLVEGLLSLRDESNEKQSATMDIKHPLFY